MSVFAGNPMLINLRKLIDKGWLPRMSLPTYITIQIEQAFHYRHQMLKDAYFHFVRNATSQDKQAFDTFVQQHEQTWLKDYALFCALKDFYSGACWWNWGNIGHRNHDADSLHQFIQRGDKKYSLERYYFEQFAFFTQWQELKQYANNKGVYLFGDMPFFVARDGVEVWAHREYFQLNQTGVPLFLSGSSPESDYFRLDKGQCWGHPLYNWGVASEENFQWWLRRFEVVNRLFDIVRLTYFRGFHQCWAIHNNDEQSINPKNGEWQTDIPSRALFGELQKRAFLFTSVAEDIGVTDEVIELRNEFKFSGMKLLQLAFDIKQEERLKNYHLPHNHLPRDVVYTGTHDSDTTKSWFSRSRYEERQRFVCSYLDAKPEDMPFPLIRAAFQSVSKLAMIPMQDFLSLEGECRMNTPGTSKHSNWRWQFQWAQITYDTEQKIKELVEQYERS